VHSTFSEWFFDFSLVKLTACLKPPSRANYRTIMTYWKDATTPLGSYFNPQRAIGVIAKITFELFQPRCWNCVIGEEWKVPKWAKGGMHKKRLGTTGIKTYNHLNEIVKNCVSYKKNEVSCSYVAQNVEWKKIVDRKVCWPQPALSPHA